MQVGYKRMNWHPTPTAWQQTIGWRQKRLAAEKRIEDQVQPVVNGIAAAQQNQVSGQAAITLQIATARIQKAAQEKIAQLTNLQRSV